MLKNLFLLMSVVCCASTSWAQHKTTVPVSKLDSMQYLENVVVYAKKPYQEVIPAQTLSGKRLRGSTATVWLMLFVISLVCKSRTTAVWAA